MIAETVARNVPAHRKIRPAGWFEQTRNVHHHVGLLIGKQHVQHVEANDGIERVSWQIGRVVRVIAVSIEAFCPQKSYVLPVATTVVQYPAL